MSKSFNIAALHHFYKLRQNTKIIMIKTQKDNFELTSIYFRERFALLLLRRAVGNSAFLSVSSDALIILSPLISGIRHDALLVVD